MSAGDTSIFYSNQRVNKEDMDFIAEGVRVNSQEFIRDLFLGASVSRVLKGFEVELGANDVTVFLGTALGIEKTAGEVRYGQLLSQGPASRVIDTTGRGAGNYVIWVRYTLDKTQQETVVFWDSEAGVEYTESKPVREIGNWDATIRLAVAGPPGPEWIRIAQFTRVTAPSNNNESLVHQAKLYFEGDAATGYAPEWGTGNDRNVDRFAYGIKNLREWVQAMRAKIGELTGDGAIWYEAVTSQGVEGGVRDMLRLDDSRYMEQGITLRAADASKWIKLDDDSGNNKFQISHNGDRLLVESWNASAAAYFKNFQVFGGDVVGEVGVDNVLARTIWGDELGKNVYAEILDSNFFQFVPGGGVNDFRFSTAWDRVSLNSCDLQFIGASAAVEWNADFRISRRTSEDLVWDHWNATAGAWSEVARLQGGAEIGPTGTAGATSLSVFYIGDVSGAEDRAIYFQVAPVGLLDYVLIKSDSNTNNCRFDSSWHEIQFHNGNVVISAHDHTGQVDDDVYIKFKAPNYGDDDFRFKRISDEFSIQTWNGAAWYEVMRIKGGTEIDPTAAEGKAAEISFGDKIGDNYWMTIVVDAESASTEYVNFTQGTNLDGWTFDAPVIVAGAITASSGNITASTGSINATNSSINAGTNLTGGTSSACQIGRFIPLQDFAAPAVPTNDYQYSQSNCIVAHCIFSWDDASLTFISGYNISSTITLQDASTSVQLTFLNNLPSSAYTALVSGMYNKIGDGAIPFIKSDDRSTAYVKVGLKEAGGPTVQPGNELTWTAGDNDGVNYFSVVVIASQ